MSIAEVNYPTNRPPIYTPEIEDDCDCDYHHDDNDSTTDNTSTIDDATSYTVEDPTEDLTTGALIGALIAGPVGAAIAGLIGLIGRTSLKSSLTMDGSGGSYSYIDNPICNKYNVKGDNNQVFIKGDSGANTFNIGGYDNTVIVQNIGSNDTINLEGDISDWEIIQEGDNTSDLACDLQGDGYIVLKNKETGTTVILTTDGGNGSAFLKEKLGLS